MKRKFRIAVSQNGGEFIGYTFIECVGSVVRDEYCEDAVYAGNVRIEFDEQIRSVTEVGIDKN